MSNFGFLHVKWEDIFPQRLNNWMPETFLYCNFSFYLPCLLYWLTISRSRVVQTSELISSWYDRSSSGQSSCIFVQHRAHTTTHFGGQILGSEQRSSWAACLYVWRLESELLIRLKYRICSVTFYSIHLVLSSININSVKVSSKLTDTIWHLIYTD